MKKALLVILISTLPLQPAFAGAIEDLDCKAASVLGTLMILSITSAPTGTGILMEEGCKSTLLILQEDSIQYKMTGEMSELLQASVLEAQKSVNQLTEDQIVDKFLSINLN
ncbi:MAG: hypothetical protein J7501_04605 [Bdellovibrio sp.]|nr:hypothetical protein [Bdellovibrio sp.]